MPVVRIGSFRNIWIEHVQSRNNDNMVTRLSRHKNPTQPPFRHGDHDRHDETEAGLSNTAQRTLCALAMRYDCHRNVL